MSDGRKVYLLPATVSARPNWRPVYTKGAERRFRRAKRRNLIDLHIGQGHPVTLIGPPAIVR
jgi:hypothetical protein